MRDVPTLFVAHRGAVPTLERARRFRSSIAQTKNPSSPARHQGVGAFTVHQASTTAASDRQSERRPAFPGGRRGFVVMGKLRRLVRARDAYNIPTDRQDFARVIARVLVDTGKLTGDNLAYWIAWTGLPTLPAGQVMWIVEEAFRKRDEARSRGRLTTLGKREAGELLELTALERDELRFWTFDAVDETSEDGRTRRAQERAAQRAMTAASDADLAALTDRRARDAARKRAKRRADGKPTSTQRSRAAEDLEAEIRASGLSRATFFRHRKATHQETVASAETVASMGGLSGGNNLRLVKDASGPVPSSSTSNVDGSGEALQAHPRRSRRRAKVAA